MPQAKGQLYTTVAGSSFEFSLEPQIRKCIACCAMSEKPYKAKCSTSQQHSWAGHIVGLLLDIDQDLPGHGGIH